MDIKVGDVKFSGFQNRTAVLIDGLKNKSQKKSKLLNANCNKGRKKSSVFLTPSGKVRDFFTSDSKLYYTPLEYAGIKKGINIKRASRRMDGVFLKYNYKEIPPIEKSDILYLNFKRRYLGINNYVAELFSGAFGNVSPIKVWNLSIVGAIIFGMFTMTMIYRYLGQNVWAGSEKKDDKKIEEVQGKVLGEEKTSPEIDYIEKLLKEYESKSENELEKEIRKMVKGYPIENMVPFIAKKDKVVAAFMIAIAKKESNWGKRVPVLDGQDCYNYWGYRGKREKMGTGGHTCFDSPKDAVDTIAKRIDYLVSEAKRNTPQEMVVWKCGYDCSWDNPAAVRKWISDVEIYFNKLSK